ncbi:MAG TPA: CcmD family protein [Vicinamibacterales bacterium]|jgi:CcmD family protein|nr:CcmD family protein [Vicinamibacterales bacterium]
MIRRVLTGLCSALLTTALTTLPALAAQPPTGQSEFVPMKDLPPGEQVPAATLLVVGYSFIWVAVAFYVWTIWRRLNRVEAEMRALAQKTPHR